MKRWKTYKFQLALSASAIVLGLFPLYPALGQTVNIGCAQDFDTGEHVACSNGTLRIRPDGTTVLTGCLATLTAPQAAQCTVSVTGGVPIQNVVVDFPTTPINISAGAENVSLNDFRIEKTTATGTTATLTLTPLQIAAPVNIDVGATMSFSDNQPQGTYTGNVNIRARFN